MEEDLGEIIGDNRFIVLRKIGSMRRVEVVECYLIRWKKESLRYSIWYLFIFF